MEKQKRWHLFAILAVIVWTLYNILPTLFYYSKPLHEPIDAKRAEYVAVSASNRVNQLEEDSVSWLKSFSNLLGVTPTSIDLKKEDPRLIEVAFKSKEEADLFSRFLPRAGELISFVPAQMQLFPGGSPKPTSVLVARQIGVQMAPKEVTTAFHFAPKYDENGQLDKSYQSYINDRVSLVAHSLGAESPQALQLEWIATTSDDGKSDDLVLSLAKEISDIERTFGASSPLIKRYFATFGQSADSASQLNKFTLRLEALKVKLKKEETGKDQGKGETYSIHKQDIAAIDRALASLKREMPVMTAKTAPFSMEKIQKDLEKGQDTLTLQQKNPLIESIYVDRNGDKMNFILYKDVAAILANEEVSESASLKKEKLTQWLIDTVARVSRNTDETVLSDGGTFYVKFHQLANPTGILAFDLRLLAQKQIEQMTDQINRVWNPEHQDLKREAYPLLSFAELQKKKAQDQKLALVSYASSLEQGTPPKGLRTGSLYFIAKGMDTLLQKARATENAPESKQLITEINDLARLLQSYGFIGYPGASIKGTNEFAKDYIFELDDFYSMWLKATREDFYVKGSKTFALLEMTDVEQRLLTENKIDDRIQEDLLKWEEEYQTAQIDLNAQSRYLVPKPTKNPYFENFKLSVAKYFRGDERKIIKWGLDLSGGKTVRVGLTDVNGRTVSNPDDLRQAVNELYDRINKLGVSERTIKIESNNIVLDFPGSQGLSAQELVKASSMYFHIVNEKFSSSNPALKEAVNQFLQNVWNEAVVTNRKDVASINEIAWRHLGGDLSDSLEELNPKTDVGKILYDNGLRLANPKNQTTSVEFNDTLSRIGILRGEDYAEWEGQPNPLVFIFHNYALEGSNLTNIQVGYEQTQGNVLSFSIKGSYSGSERSGNPRDDFFAWTSQFAEDRIQGTPKEAYSGGRGWRMAVVLNGSIISKPSLKAALRDAATISGRFTQREINQLAADLKAGSLSFTPKILAEENVSPELGKEERTKGLVASVVSLVAVVALMVYVYRFAGVVASVAVLFNILIMWGVLQNLDAALTLPGIAGIVLTIGMAVDANVLVFERIREEFAISRRLSSAIQTGYKKAFSAIVDSNVTTIIAALILIQFDSGPIRGFAVTLIIGIISSMFTALFVTRYYFTSWVQNPAHKELPMRNVMPASHIDFLALSKKAIVASLILTLIGGFVFFQERKTLFGMDFTGGYSLQLTVEEKPGIDSYRLLTEDALIAKGAGSNDVQIRELSRPNQLKIQLGMGMEEKGHPFYQMPQEIEEGATLYGYQKNPRIAWVVNALESSGMTISQTELSLLDKNWTVMSGQFSDSMRFNASIGLAIALLSILLYITFRFEWKYALGAVIGLAHDLLISLGILAIFHKMGMAVQIDLQIVGALMTIIGYSLNDTIIIFDRIREDVKLMRKSSFYNVVNHALNVTLSRTLMTSGTTLAVLLSLVFLGGKSLFGFSLVMTIGVIVGTYSSLFIAAPALLYFHQREKERTEIAST